VLKIEGFKRYNSSTAALFSVSRLQMAYEKENDAVLPHTGNLHDMGSSISYKAMIIKKVIKEKKDPLYVARETMHTLPAVDKYLKDYQRVKMCYK